MSDGKVAMVQGRIVWASGDLFKGKVQTNYGTQVPKIDAKTGQQSIQYGFGLAVPKANLADPEKGAIWMAMYEQAWSMYPSRVIPPSFAMKFKDGDNDVDEDGQPYSAREGYAGNMVFAMTTNLPIRYFRHEGGQNIQVSDGIKCGDYVNVQVTVKAHGAVGNGKAGLYLNPMAVQLVAPGKEIINAPSADNIFGNAAPTPPAGYVAPAAPAMPNFAPQPANTPPGYAGPAMTPPPMPSPMPAAPAPHFAVLPPQHQPPPGGVPAPYAPPPMAAPPQYQPPQQPAFAAPAGFPPIPR